MNLHANLLLSLVLVFMGPVAFAADMGMGQGRLFLGSTKTAPTELNTELTAQGIKNVDLNNSFGVEITFPTFQYLQLGLRYTHHLIGQDETNADPSTDYKASLTQDSMMGIARVPFFKSDFVHMDIFVGAGVSASAFTLKTASQDGKLEKATTPNLAAGASLSFGYKKYFLTLEGGYESNKLEDFKRTGNINSNVTAMDLSGSYFLIGFMFDGIPIFTK